MAKKNTKNIIYIVGGVIVLGALFAWPIITDDTRELVKVWEDAGVDCLAGGHQAASLHIHPQIRITVDGLGEGLPENVGSVLACTMAEIHTHDASGTLHLESVLPAKEFTLGQFAVVYGQPLKRDGYNLEVRANGEVVEEVENLVLKDRQVIELIYTSVEE